MAEPLRKWYFAVNEAGFSDVMSQLRIAIGSCRANTQLSPLCLYNGDDPAHVAWLSDRGVRVIRHQSSLSHVLRAGYGAQYPRFSGHWLRIDIPLIEHDDDLVLYTDIDVMFLGQPVLRRRPRYLAAAPERYRWRWPHFNSGVMALNLPGMRRVHDTFVAQITRRMQAGWRPPGHDQVSYNRMFRWRHGLLPHTMNWKPYWGLSPDARIVHFHGPKPEHVTRIMAGQTDDMLPVYRRLHALNPAAYAHYARLAEPWMRD